MTVVRSSIWDLENSQPWHPVTLAYANAITELQSRAATDTTSWTYQAAIHGSPATPASRGWNQCQHGGWFFLPWHRIYLYFFERIVRSVIVSQGGSPDWALPYWNYEGGGASNTIPIPFREPTLPNGDPNPLLVTQRNAQINSGRTIPSQIASSAAAMSEGIFTPPPPPAFGGGQTGFEHFFTLHGRLELTPHNAIHSFVGGSNGLMADPDQAALDPIFWLHHSNIDRLWNEWVAGGRSNPTDPAWLDQSFELFDENGSPQTMRVRDTLDTDAQLNYRYDTAPAVVAPPWPGRYLRYPPMTRGDDVRQWQQQIVSRGFTIAVDGAYGPRSKAACQMFQTQQALVPDGIVGPITWGATFATP